MDKFNLLKSVWQLVSWVCANTILIKKKKKKKTI